MKYMEQLQTRSWTEASGTSVYFKDFECPTAEVDLKKWELGSSEQNSRAYLSKITAIISTKRPNDLKKGELDLFRQQEN
jgi:hypothetical protein